jgi:hypothetical protein
MPDPACCTNGKTCTAGFQPRCRQEALQAAVQNRLLASSKVIRSEANSCNLPLLLLSGQVKERADKVERSPSAPGGGRY